MSASATGAERSWGQAIAIGVRRLAAVTAAGGLLGLLVGGVGGRLAMLFFKYEMNSRTADCSSVVSCETICVRLSASTSDPFQQSIPALGGPQLDEANPAERCVPDTHRLPRAARQC